MAEIRFDISAAGPDRWRRLADYNGEVARGIVHTAEYDSLMADEQRAFDGEQERRLRAEGYRPAEGGGWIRFPRSRSRRRWWAPWRRVSEWFDG